MQQIRFLTIALLFLIGRSIYAQNTSELPYRTIPDYSNQYTATTVVARMIDGLGFRYYWATEGLTMEDLGYTPNENARTTEETLDHILNLCLITSYAIQQIPFEGFDVSGLTFTDKRKITLEQLQIASDILKNNPEKSPEDFPIVFKSMDSSKEYPFWNILNGPLADALWHVGQVVSFRRSSGNPINSKVDVFSGAVRGE